MACSKSHWLLTSYFAQQNIAGFQPSKSLTLQGKCLEVSNTILKLFLSVLETKKKTVLQVLFNSHELHVNYGHLYRVFVGISTKSSNVYWEVNIESTKSMYVQKFGRGSTARGGGATVRRRACVCVRATLCVWARPAIASRCSVCWHIMYIWMNQIIWEYEFYFTTFFFLSQTWNINPFWAPRLRSRKN